MNQQNVLKYGKVRQGIMETGLFYQIHYYTLSDHFIRHNNRAALPELLSL